MAVSKTDSQILWATANTKSVSSGSGNTSDALTLLTDGFKIDVHCQANNDGTPASGDIVDFYALFTGGDPGGGGSDVYDTTGHGTHLCSLDTNAEDPAVATVSLPACPKAMKIYAYNNSTGRAITVSVGITEYAA